MNTRFSTLGRILVLMGMLVILPSLTFANAFESYAKTFMTTGYYSPLPEQEHYVTGSYYSDKALNGNGTNGASGAEVFPGMLAAPASYRFGSKINIEGMGMMAVEDRGGAIVQAGQRGESYDRLDIWMGAGDIGLRRALLWGKRLVQATVYGVRPDLVVDVTFNNWSDDELELVRYWKQFASYANDYGTAKLFPHDLWLGQTSDKVQEMETLLSQLGYFASTPDAMYDEVTAASVFNFQRDNDIVYSLDELGAGHFGPQTRVTIEKAKELFEKGEYVNQTAYLEKIQSYGDLKEEFSVFTDELSSGDRADEVAKLQVELKNLGYLRIEPTGLYGEVTKNAVTRFQLKMGIISSADAHGAGVVGPQTQAALNSIFDDRIEAKGLIAVKRGQIGVPGDLMIAAY